MSTNTILATTPLVSTNYLLRATGTTIGNSLIFDNGTNVGIGTTTFPYTSSGRGYLSINGSTDCILEFQVGGSSSGYLYSTANNLEVNANGSRFLQFNTNSSERMRITSAGDILVGLTSSTYSTTNRRSIVANGTTTALFGLVAGGVNKGYFYTTGTDIYLMSEDAAGSMIFGTANAERMRITSGGRVLINTTSVSSAGMSTGLFQVNSEIFSVGSVAGLFWENRSGGVTYNSNWYGFYTTSGQIYLYSGSANLASVNMSSGAWQGLSPSDRRLKDNIQEYDKGLKDILKLNVKQWEYNGKAKTVKGDKGVGLIADELEKVIPEFVLDYENYLEDGDAKKTTLKRVDLSELNFILVKAIQEQNQTIEELSNRLIKLESK